METRTLRIWDRKAIDLFGLNILVSGKCREEYNGPYVESYKPIPENMKESLKEHKEFRIVLIYDDTKNRAAVFQQVVENRYDYIPTDIVMWLKDGTSEESVMVVWSTDSQHAIPPRFQAFYKVLDFTNREPTEEDNVRNNGRIF